MKLKTTNTYEWKFEGYYIWPSLHEGRKQTVGEDIFDLENLSSQWKI